MPGFVLILGIVVAGALLGFFFSKKGQEREGAIQGAKLSCGCIFAVLVLIIAAVVVVALALSGTL